MSDVIVSEDRIKRLEDTTSELSSAVIKLTGLLENEAENRKRLERVSEKNDERYAEIIGIIHAHEIKFSGVTSENERKISAIAVRISTAVSVITIAASYAMKFI